MLRKLRGSSGRILGLGRAAWFVVALASLTLYFASLPEVWRALQRPESTWSLDDSLAAFYFVSTYVVLPIVFFATGAVIFWRKSDNAMALLAAVMLVAFVTFVTLGPWQAQDAGTLPDALKLTGQMISLLGAVCAILFLYTFPSARFVPGWAAVLALVWIGSDVNGIFFATRTNSQNEPLPSLLTFVVPGISSIFAQIYRYLRVSNEKERQQTRWVLFGITVGFGGYLCMSILVPLFVQNAQYHLALSSVSSLLLTLIPLSIAIAILRSRLWDIDLIINRTLVYGTLTGALLLIYFGSVVLLEQLVRSFTSQTHSDLVVVASTLAIAALFSPLRKRIQAFIDRRFYRRKYDAAKTLAAFSATLRDEVDLDRLTGRLLEVVEETMQPAQVSLWLRQPESKAR